MPRKRQPTQLLPISISQSANPTAETKGNEQGPGSPKQHGRRSEAAPPSSPAPPPNCTTHWEPSRLCLERALSPGGAAADFGTAFAVRRPPLWPPGGLAGNGRFRVGPDAFGALSRQVGCRGNARRGSHRDRAAAIAGGRCPRLWAVAARGLPSDCARRAACRAPLPPTPRPSGRVGALDRGRDARGESAFAPASSAAGRRGRGWLARPAR